MKRLLKQSLQSALEFKQRQETSSELKKKQQKVNESIRVKEIKVIEQETD